MSEKTVASFQGRKHRLQMVQFDDGTFEMRDNRKVIFRCNTEYYMIRMFYHRIYEIMFQTKLNL